MMTRLLAGLAAAAVLATPPARAEDPTRRGFDPDPARLALSLDGGFAVETAGAAPAKTYGLAAILDLSAGLLSLELGGERDRLLEHRLSLHLLGAYSLGRVELGVEVPVALWQDSDFSLLTKQGIVNGPLIAPIARTALGDVRLGAKVPVLRQESSPVGLAAMLDLRLPTGNGDAFYSDGLSVVPSAIVTRSFGRVRLDAQGGYQFRRTGQYAQLVVHDGWTYGAGANVDLPKLGRLERWRAIAEVVGGWPRGYDLSGARYRAPLSARAGLRWFAWRDLSVEAGGGAGLGQAGYGREAWRVFAGVRWVPQPRTGAAALAPMTPDDDDWDKDGIPNAKDECPREAGPAETGGCPDRDGDGIPDKDDKCPDQPGPAQNDGCPVAEGEPLVEIETERLSLKDAIHFDTAKDTIKQESFKILDQVAELLKQHAELKKVRVEGHTDNVGSGPYNKDLSHRRARSVVRYLVERGGVPARRLEAEGFGFERPVASNATAVGRAKNRRVEFTILGEGTP
jgi:outer membrane protein OmpA-like peptidoglycan-associated protein